MRAIMADLGLATNLIMNSDATAAIGMVGRQGLGKVRHLAVADLWVQQTARKRLIDFNKTPGISNPADMGTKPLDRPDMERHCQRLGLTIVKGRAETAPMREQKTTPGVESSQSRVCKLEFRGDKRSLGLRDIPYRPKGRGGASGRRPRLMIRAGLGKTEGIDIWGYP